MTAVEPLKKFLRSQRLRWFGDVERMSKEKAPAMAMKIMMRGKKNGRPKKRWMEVVQDTRRRRFATRIREEKARTKSRLQETTNPASSENTSYPLLRKENGWDRM